jgi:preprotein translocase subunit SecE
MRRQAVAGRPVVSKVVNYVREVMSELRKVVWPTREEIRRLTVMVIIIAGAVGVLLGAIDLGFTHLVNLFLGG